VKKNLRKNLWGKNAGKNMGEKWWRHCFTDVAPLSLSRPYQDRESCRAGASAVLVFGVIESKLAQPRNLVGGSPSRR